MSRTSWAFFGSGRTATQAARNVAQGFADHLNSVLNRTVSDARLTLLSSAATPDQFTVTCLDGEHPRSFALRGSSLRLFVSQNIEVDGDKVHTASSAYRLGTDDRKDAWLLRWEYYRRPPLADYPYPLAHVHINAGLLDSDVDGRLTKPLPQLHIPTARVPLELVLWHLLAEWGIGSKADDWQNVLRDSLEGFYERMTSQ